MCDKSLLFSRSRGLSNASITPAACRLMDTNCLTKVSSINISLRKLISVINTSCSGGWWNSATTPVTGQNDTRQLIKGTNYSIVTGHSYINSSSPTKSLPSFMCSSSSHPGSAHKIALVEEGAVLFLLSTMGWSCYLQGLQRQRIGTSVYACASVTSPFCCKKTLMLLSTDSRVKRMNIDSGA